MQIKTHPSRHGLYQENKLHHILARLWGEGNSCMVSEMMNVYTVEICGVCSKTKNRSAIWPSCIYLKDSIFYDQVICIYMLAVLLFTLAMKCKHLRYLTDEWIVKMWYVYTIELYFVLKKNETMKFTGKWTELEKSYWMMEPGPTYSDFMWVALSSSLCF